MDRVGRLDGNRRPLLKSASVLLAMHEISTDPTFEFPDQVREILTLGCRQFGLPVAAVTYRDGDELRVLYAVAANDELTEGTVFELCNTFCQEVLKVSEVLAITHAEESEWRTHPGFMGMGIQAYLGAPIQLHGRIWGTTCFVGFEGRTTDFAQEDFALLELIAQRLQLGLEHDSVRDKFKSVLRASAGPDGDGVLVSAIESLSDVLGADVAFVAECLEGNKARALVFLADGEWRESFEYETTGTPCGAIRADGHLHHPSGIQKLYPSDEALAAEGLEGLVGAPLIGMEGRVIGHLMALRRSPMKLTVHDRWLIDLLAARAASELERQRAEKEQRRLEQQVLHAEKLKSLGLLAGGIAHDFNNLLMGILGNLDLAEGELLPGSSVQERLARVRRAALRAEGLTKQMLLYAGQAPLRVESVNLSELADEIPDLLGAAVSKGAVIETDLIPGLPSVKADASQMRQIVMNLVMNAADACRGGGRIRLRTGLADLSEEDIAELTQPNGARPGYFVFLEVQDDGVGMDEQTARSMFDPFFTTKALGQGLGLSAVMGIVQRHEGALSVTSRKGEGTSIRVYLPLTRSGGENPERRLEKRKSPRVLAGTVLLVEDEETVRDALDGILKRSGMDVLAAGDGNQGLQLFQEEQVDVVLLDYTIPGMDGGSVALKMKEISPQIPIVLMSGFNNPADGSDGLAKRLSGFVQKPFEPSALLEVLHQALGASSKS